MWRETPVHSELDLTMGEIKPDLTPLIDAIFLLLIFFMVSVVFARPVKVAVDLAPAEQTEAAEQRQVRLTITHSGELELMGETVTEAGLAAALEKYDPETHEGRLTILVDRRASHGHTLAAMQAAAARGFTKVYLATRSKKSDH